MKKTFYAYAIGIACRWNSNCMLIQFRLHKHIFFTPYNLLIIK